MPSERTSPSGTRTRQPLGFLRPLCMGCLLCLCLCLSSLSFSQETAAQPVVYAFGLSGRFIKIAIGPSITVTDGSLAAAAGNRKMFPSTSGGHGSFSEGEWLGTDYLYDKALGRIFAVVPAADAHAYAAQRMSLVSMRIPQMKVDAKMALPTDSGLALLLSPDGERLFISGGEELRAPANGSLEFSTTIYTAADLKPVKKYVQVVDRQKFMLAAVEDQVSFQQGAYFSRDGSVIFDRMSTLRIKGEGFERRNVNAFALLTASDRDALRGFETVDAASGKSYLPIAFESSAAGVLLLRVVDDRQATQALISIDMETEKVLRILQVPLGRASLTPDAKMILLELLRRGASAPGQTPSRELFKTGSIAAYDPRTGSLLKTYEAQALAGNEETHRIACFDPASRSFIYEAASQLYLVRGSLDEQPIRISSSFIAGPETSCVYTEL